MVRGWRRHVCAEKLCRTPAADDRNGSRAKTTKTNVKAWQLPSPTLPRSGALAMADTGQSDACDLLTAHVRLLQEKNFPLAERALVGLLGGTLVCGLCFVMHL